MMMTLYNDYKKINGFTDVSIADHDEDPDNQLFNQNLCQNLTKFDTVK